MDDDGGLVMQILREMRNSALAGLAYLGIMCGFQATPWLYSEEIKGKENIEKVFIEEKTKLGLENKNIALFIYSDEDEVPFAAPTQDGGYLVALTPTTIREDIKHELYHIADGHCDRSYLMLRYLFWDEPQATIYSLTGLKL